MTTIEDVKAFVEGYLENQGGIALARSVLQFIQPEPLPVESVVAAKLSTLAFTASKEVNMADHADKVAELIVEALRNEGYKI